jgi:hypothetical protein
MLVVLFVADVCIGDKHLPVRDLKINRSTIHIYYKKLERSSPGSDQYPN